MDSGSIQADLFPLCITLDFMHICYAFDDSLLNPFVHLVFIVIEPVAAEDVTTSKRWRCHVANTLSDRWIVRTLSIPPKGLGGVIDPTPCRELIPLANEFSKLKRKELMCSKEHTFGHSPTVSLCRRPTLRGEVSSFPLSENVLQAHHSISLFHEELSCGARTCSLTQALPIREAIA